MTANFITISSTRGEKAHYELGEKEQFAYDAAALLGFDAGLLPISWLNKPQHDFVTDLRAVQTEVETRLVAMACKDTMSVIFDTTSPKQAQAYLDKLVQLQQYRHDGYADGYLQSYEFLAALRNELGRISCKLNQFPINRKAWNALRTHPKFAIATLNPEYVEFVTRAPIVLQGLSQGNIGHWAVRIRVTVDPMLTFGPAFANDLAQPLRAHPHIRNSRMCFGDSEARAEDLCAAAWTSTARMKKLLSFLHERLLLHTVGDYDTRDQTSDSFKLRDLAHDYDLRYADTLTEVLAQYEIPAAPAKLPKPTKRRVSGTATPRKAVRRAK